MAQGKKTIYTLGTSNRSLEEFLGILQAYGIRQVIDVRRFPVSSRFPWFNRENLARVLPQKGLEYIYMGQELGGYRKGGYQAHTQSQTFQEALASLEDLATPKPTAIICAERLPWRCHRRHIAQALEKRGWRVIHILDRDRTWTPSAQMSLFHPQKDSPDGTER